MPCESVCQVVRSWMDVGNFQTRLVVQFVIFTATVRNILDNSRIYVFRMLFAMNSECLSIQLQPGGLKNAEDVRSL
jgi:hypothetical protein